MAELGIIESFHAIHGSKPHEHDFKVEVVLKGYIDQTTHRLEGIDHHDLISDIKKIIAGLENQNLREILTKEDYNSSGNEAIALYFLKKLIKKFPIKYVQIWETQNRYARVFSEDITQ